MDLEQSLKFTDAQARVLERERMEREQLASERKREAIEFLKTRKMFKNLLPTDEAIKNFKDCKDYLFLNVVIPQIGISITADYANGYKNALEGILNIVEQYNTKVREV